MKSNMARPALTACALASLLALAACGDRIEDAEMPQAQQANVEINRQGMDGAKAAEEAAGVRNDGSVKVATGDSSVFDPDVLVAEQVKAALSANPDFGAVKIDVHSDEGEVTLRGTAPDPAARERASEIARSVRNVKSVDNQLTLG
jgi:hyperosmotically inducible protein